jgi:hypothetical protein
MTLSATYHAKEMATSRAIAIPDVLPEDARLAMRDEAADTYKVDDERGGYFLVVKPNGAVLTVYRLEKKKMAKCQQCFQRRARRKSQ